MHGDVKVIAVVLELGALAPLMEVLGGQVADLELLRENKKINEQALRRLDKQGQPATDRIKMVEASKAEGPLADLYARSKAQSVSGVVPDILRTMSLRPDFLTAIDQASRLHFSDGALTRAEHEMIASYVSALNRCRY